MPQRGLRLTGRRAFTLCGMRAGALALTHLSMEGSELSGGADALEDGYPRARLPQAPVVLAALALGLLARARQRHEHERRRLTGGLRSALDRFGTGMDPRHHLRIHLAWHEGESRWLIGHVGRHLTNTKT